MTLSATSSSWTCSWFYAAALLHSILAVYTRTRYYSSQLPHHFTALFVFYLTICIPPLISFVFYTLKQCQHIVSCLIINVNVVLWRLSIRLLMHSSINKLIFCTSLLESFRVVVKPNFTFSFLDLTKLSKEEKQQLHQQLYTESIDMTRKFQSLFSATTESLKRQKVSIRSLVCHLVGLGPFLPTYEDL